MSWKLITLKQYPVFSRQWLSESLRDEMKEIGYGFTRYKSLNSGIYADEKEHSEMKEMMVKKLLNNPIEIKQHALKWISNCNDLVNFAKEANGMDFCKLPDDKLMALLDEAVKKFKRTSSHIFLADVLGDFYEEWLSEKVNSKEFQVLTTCTRKTGVYEAHQELLKMASLEGKRKNDAVREYTERFKWLGYDTGVGRDFTLEDTYRKLEAISRKEKKQERENGRASIFQRFTERERFLLEVMDDLIYARAYRGESQSIAGMHLRRLFEEIAKRCSTDYDSLVYLTFDEINESLKRKSIDENLIKERQMAFGVVMIDGKIEIYSGDEVKRLEPRENITNLKEITGMVASPGIVRGNVKIVNSTKDFSKVQTGDILITKMTTPEFMVALEKCAGIVTDVGGITCHAAIIARELDKPCIIGTKYATQILKDGDLVEVDANKGVVRKL